MLFGPIGIGARFDDKDEDVSRALIERFFPGAVAVVRGGNAGRPPKPDPATPMAALEALGVRVFMPHIGEFATSMEMAGLSLTVMKLNPELKEYLLAPAATPFYTNANKV